MTTVTYGFEGGTNGANVSAGAGAGPGDTNFDATSFASATDIYDNTRAAHGVQSNKIATSSSSSSYNSWAASVGTQTTVYIRAYLYFTAAPSVQHRVINFVGSAASRGTCLATTSGTLIFTDASGTTRLTSAAFPTGQWFRLEAMFTGSATVGQWIYKIWYQPDAPASSTPSDTQTSAASLNTGGTLDTYRFGISSNVASAGPFWQDDLGVSTTGFIGPAATQIPAPAQLLTASRRAAARGRWTQPATANANAAPPALGAANIFPHLTVARRYPARGWFAAGAGPALPPAVPGAGVVQPHLVVARRAAARAAWHGTAVPAITAPPGIPGSQPGGLIGRRPRSRCLWQGTATRTVNAPPVAVAAPLQRPAIPRRTASRASWHGNAANPSNAAPAVPAVVFTYGTPRFAWEYGTPSFAWEYGTPVTS